MSEKKARTPCSKRGEAISRSTCCSQVAWLAQSAARRRVQQLRIGRRVPQQEADPRRQRIVIEPLPPHAGSGSLRSTRKMKFGDTSNRARPTCNPL